MGYEIDFLPVGKENKSGDAIAIRFGNLYGTREEQAVVVIDGGFAPDGEALVNHILKYYKTDLVDIVIATHPHNDHISGLKTVLEKMRVQALLMHKPWASTHTNNISRWFIDGRVTDNSVREAQRIIKYLDRFRKNSKPKRESRLSNHLLELTEISDLVKYILWDHKKNITKAFCLNLIVHRKRIYLLEYMKLAKKLSMKY